MSVIANTRWRKAATPHQPATVGVTEMLLLKLAELDHHKCETARLEAEIAPLARTFADAHGEYLRPTPAQLRSRLGLK